jgi:hypothetical protein
MANQSQPPTIDPDNVPETLCDGRFYLTWSGTQLATLTFTHARPDASPLFDQNSVNDRFVVRARIVMSLPNLIGLRDVLNRSIQEGQVPAPAAAGGPVRH